MPKHRPRSRLFILGAGFSKPAGLPLASQLTTILRAHLKQYPERLPDYDAAIRASEVVYGQANPGIEAVFDCLWKQLDMFKAMSHFTAFDYRDLTDSAETRRIRTTLDILYRALGRLLWEQSVECSLSSVTNWAKSISPSDQIVTFNYDVLCERALSDAGRPWRHDFKPLRKRAIGVMKLHGSVDWSRYLPGAPPSRELEKAGCSVLYDAERDINLGRGTGNPFPKKGERDDLVLRREVRRIVRVPDFGTLRQISGDWFPPLFHSAMIGMSETKKLGDMLGMGCLWGRAASAIQGCEDIVAIGFSLSDFDRPVGYFFSEQMRAREEAGLAAPRLRIVDPQFKFVNERYERIFGVVPEKLGDSVDEVEWSKS